MGFEDTRPLQATASQLFGTSVFNHKISKSNPHSSPSFTSPKPKLVPHMSDGSVISSLSVGSPYGAGLLSPPGPQTEDGSPPFRAAFDDPISLSMSRFGEEKRIRRYKSASFTWEGNEPDTWSHQGRPEFINQSKSTKRFRISRRRSCPIIRFSVTRQPIPAPFPTTDQALAIIWAITSAVTDELLLRKQLDQRTAAARKRRWSLQCKARPSRAVSRASDTNRYVPPTDENSRLNDDRAHNGPLERPHDQQEQWVESNSAPGNKRQGDRSRARVDTPAMITLRRASTKKKDHRVTFLSKISSDENEQSQLTPPQDALKKVPHFSGSKTRKECPRVRDPENAHILSRKSRPAEPATTIAELQIAQKPVEETMLSEPELRRRKSGCAKIISGTTFHEVIWEDYTPSSSTSSKSLMSETCVLREANEFHPSIGAEVRRFSIPEIPSDLVAHLKDPNRLSTKTSDPEIGTRRSTMPLSSLAKPLQRLFSWSLNGRKMSELMVNQASATQTRRSSLSFFGFRGNEPFRTQLEDNGYTAAVDRVEFFPPLESRSGSVSWQTTGVANLNNPFLGRSQSSDSVPMKSSSVSPFNEASGLTHPFQEYLLSERGQHGPNISPPRRKSWDERRRPEMGRALGACSHVRRKSADPHRCKTAPTQIKGDSSDGLAALGMNRVSTHPAIPGLKYRSMSDTGEAHGISPKPLHPSSRAYSMADLFLPLRYIHSLSHRQKSSSVPGVEVSQSSVKMLTSLEETTSPTRTSCSGDVYTPVSVDWIG